MGSHLKLQVEWAGGPINLLRTCTKELMATLHIKPIPKFYAKFAAKPNFMPAFQILVVNLFARLNA